MFNKSRTYIASNKFLENIIEYDNSDDNPNYYYYYYYYYSINSNYRWISDLNCYINVGHQHNEHHFFAYIFDNHIIYRLSQNICWVGWSLDHLSKALHPGNVRSELIKNIHIKNLGLATQLLQHHSDQLPEHLQELLAEFESQTSLITNIRRGHVHQQHRHG